MQVRTVLASFGALVCASGAHAGLVFDFSDGPGLIALDGIDPARAAGIRSGAAAAAARWSALWADDVTLKIALDYDPGLPALGASFATFDPAGTPYPAVKGAMGLDATSAHDAIATGHLQPGPEIAMIRNATAPPSFLPIMDPGGSINNTFMDLTSSNKKALGMIPGHSGAAGSDGTLKFGDFDFDFDPSDGITADTYDFVGVALHELAHNMGFISGVDTMGVLFGGVPLVPPGDPDTAVMVTTLDLFRYSAFSAGLPGYIPDLSLPVPGLDPTRIFSIDGGLTAIEEFSTGTALAGDGEQAGHWKADVLAGLMDPGLADEYELTEWFDDTVLLSGGVFPDTVALDVIGWTRIPSPGSLPVVACALVFGARRRR